MGSRRYKLAHPHLENRTEFEGLSIGRKRRHIWKCSLSTRITSRENLVNTPTHRNLTLECGLSRF